MFKKTLLVLALTSAVLFVAGCGPSSKLTVQERRAMINDMADDSLTAFYQSSPELRSEVQTAPGYGVFSTANVSVIFATGGGGYGVVVDNATGERTYMRSGVGGLGIGLGAKDYRQLMVFNSQEAMFDFINGDWDWGGQASATAKADQKGAAATVAENVGEAVEVYTLTESGLSAELMATGTKYWVVDELNRPASYRQNGEFQRNGEFQQNGEFRQDGQFQQNGEAELNGEFRRQQQEFQQQQRQLDQQRRDLQQRQQELGQQREIDQRRQQLEQERRQLDQRQQQLEQQSRELEQRRQVEQQDQQYQQNQQTQPTQ